MVHERLVSCGGQTPRPSLPIATTTAATHGYCPPPLRAPPPLAPAKPHPFPTTTTTTIALPSLPRRPARPSSLSLSPLPLSPLLSPAPRGCCAMTSSSSRPARLDAADKGDRSEYEEALRCISSLITGRKRADGKNRGDQFDLMFQYLKILELEDAVEKLKVIHVAGTKGKGSTCSFTESILRNCGFRTGLFTSPHLIDIRERFRLDGVEISEEKFLQYFWWCWDKLHEKIDDTIPMPTYFRFLALLAFKIFSAEQVDVAIMEVGLGGKFDATNVVKAPIVCGISSLGYDHMEILGNTLGQIAGEKAGIFKENVPAYTVPQPEEAMRVLEDKASQLGISLSVIQPLSIETLNGQYLGLDGEHQYLNAGLAIALCRTWLKETGHDNYLNLHDVFHLPEKFIRGLTTTSMLGRAQVLPDPQSGRQCSTNLSFGELTFYLDGAHSPESMEMCAKWFSNVIKEDTIRESCDDETHDNQNTRQILLFNCMSVRDPQMLLPQLVNVCADHGIYFHRALFVPNVSVYNKVGSSNSTSTDTCQADLSWQYTIQRVWEYLIHGDKYSRMHGYCNGTTISTQEVRKDGKLSNLSHQENSSVYSSLPLAIKWIRDTAKENRSIHFQVLVTGSLHLIGDVLKLIKK